MRRLCLRTLQRSSNYLWDWSGACNLFLITTHRQVMTTNVRREIACGKRDYFKATFRPRMLANECLWSYAYLHEIYTHHICLVFLPNVKLLFSRLASSEACQVCVPLEVIVQREELSKCSDEHECERLQLTEGYTVQGLHESRIWWRFKHNQCERKGSTEWTRVKKTEQWMSWLIHIHDFITSC